MVDCSGTILCDVEKAYVEQLQQGNGRRRNCTFLFYHRWILQDSYKWQISAFKIDLSKLMKKYSHLGFNVIVSGNNAEITKGYDAFTNELKLSSSSAYLYEKIGTNVIYSSI